MLAGGLGGALVAVALVRRLRPRAQVRKPSEAELRRIGDELARIRAVLAEEPSPARELVEAVAAELERLAEQLERVYEESFLETATGSAFRSLRAYDHELHELTAEIRCRLAKP